VHILNTKQRNVCSSRKCIKLLTDISQLGYYLVFCGETITIIETNNTVFVLGLLKRSILFGNDRFSSGRLLLNLFTTGQLRIPHLLWRDVYGAYTVASCLSV